MLAHELRNPLAPLQNALNILQKTEDRSAAVAKLQPLMSRQVEHLTRLVDDLLDVSRITTGKIVLKRELLDLCDVANRAIELSKPLFQMRHQHFSAELPNCPVLVRGDPVRLVQALGNVLGNASKYTQDGGVISLAMFQAGEKAVVRIKDDGIGLSKEIIPTIFDLFAQADNSLARSSGGLGLGLTLVKRLLDEHAGSVEASSEGLGLGSTFELKLPLVDPDSHLRPAKPAQSVNHKRKSHCRILVVDDNLDSADSIAALLKMLGHVVVTAYDGKEALQVIQKQNPQIVLLDIGLPGESGYDIARRIRHELGRVDIILIAMTGYGQEHDKLESRQAGFDAHLVKPVDMSLLEKLVDQVDCRETAKVSIGV
jgi:CheY-like chemotaxis protein